MFTEEDKIDIRNMIKEEVKKLLKENLIVNIKCGGHRITVAIDYDGETITSAHDYVSCCAEHCRENRY